MRALITTEEIRMTARERLARAIGLFHPLTEVDVEDLCDSGVANESDFRALSSDPPTYTYCGDRWTVEYRDGRPRLIPTISVPPETPRSAVAQEEARCALTMDVLGLIKGAELTEAEIAEYRADTWDGVLAKAAERDAAAIEFTKRLGRAREILGAPAIVPRRLVGDALDDLHEPHIGRYLLIIIARVVDQLAECRIEFAEGTDEMLARVSELLTTAEGLLGIYDTDADDDDRRVGITVSTSLTNDVDQSHARRI